MLLVIQHPDKSPKAASDLGERDRQCANTLGGSDTTRSGCEFELETAPDHY